jgi:hypothetical protein
MRWITVPFQTDAVTDIPAHQEGQILLDEKLSRLEEARLDDEAFVQQEWKQEDHWQTVSTKS